LVGYFVGKMSYTAKCREKILKLENSELADAIRHRKRGGTPWSDTYVTLWMLCLLSLFVLYH